MRVKHYELHAGYHPDKGGGEYGPSQFLHVAWCMVGYPLPIVFPERYLHITVVYKIE